MKMSKAALLGSTLFFVLGCAPAETPRESHEEPAAQPREVEPATPAVAPRAPIAATDLVTAANAVVHYTNLTIVTDDPAKALARAETLLREHGAEVQHSSSTRDNANLNAKVPPESRSKLRAAIAEVGHVSSENNSSNDMSHELNRLQRRQVLLREADRRLATGFSGDPTSIDVLSLLRELTSREQQNIDAQLRSYEQQVGKAQLTISFVKHDPNSPHAR